MCWKGKGKCIYMYIALIFLVHARCSGMDHTVLPAITPMPAFTSQAFTRWRLPRLRLRTSNCSLLLICRLWKDERLSWPGWLTYSGRFTHISGYPLAADQAQDRESLPVKDQLLLCHITYCELIPDRVAIRARGQLSVLADYLYQDYLCHMLWD